MSRHYYVSGFYMIKIIIIKFYRTMFIHFPAFCIHYIAVIRFNHLLSSVTQLRARAIRCTHFISFVKQEFSFEIHFEEENRITSSWDIREAYRFDIRTCYTPIFFECCINVHITTVKMRQNIPGRISPFECVNRVNMFITFCNIKIFI